jgi:hypothetical protein
MAFFFIQIDESPFHSNACGCAACDQIMRNGVYLATRLPFKTSPKFFEQANNATSEHIKRAAQIFAKREKASMDDPAEV